MPYGIKADIGYYTKFKVEVDPSFCFFAQEISKVKEPPHVALANLLPQEECFVKFKKTYGILGENSTDRLFRRNILRQAWEGDRKALSGMQLVSYHLNARVEPSGVRLTADDAWSAARLYFLLDHQAGRTAKCGSPDCPAPYFLRVRKGQKFCSHRCAVLVSVRKLRQRQKKAMKLLQALESKTHKTKGKRGRRTGK